MITATPSRERQRFRDFEMITEGAAGILGRPEVAEKIGIVGVDFAAINAAAFLPNVRGGKIRIPRAHRDSDDLPILPVSTDEAETGLEYTRHVLGFTPTTRRAANATLAQYGLRPLLSDRLFVDLAQDEYKATKPFKQLAIVQAPQADIDGIGVIMRPLLMVGPELLKEHSPSAPAVTLHEYVHVHDMRTIAPVASDLAKLLAYTEFRGHHVSRLVQQTLGIDDVVSKASGVVERLRQNNGLEFPFRLQDVSWSLTLKMLDLGAIKRLR